MSGGVTAGEPQHFLYFLPLKHGQRSFGPIFLPTIVGSHTALFTLFSTASLTYE